MNPSFFGLEGHPFTSTPGAPTGYFADSHAALITELKAGLKAPHGITLVIGDEGTGKTSLIRTFADEMANSSTVAYLPSTGPGLRHLLTEVIEQLGGTTPPAGDEQALLDTLRQLSRARAEHQRSTIVVVDDAHELPAKTIERLGRLFGDDPSEPSMLHVILVGRPELLDRMNAANDRSILKHLVQVCRMDPIGPEESFRYIADRVAQVGGMVDRLFTEDALRLIVQRAGGSPARIDAICSAALEQAAELGDSPIGADTVDIACMQAAGFAAVENGTRTSENGGPASYVFADDDVDAGLTGSESGGSAQPVMANDDNGSSGTSTTSSPSTGARLKAALQARRSLILSAVGLIAVLGAFSALMTGGGDESARQQQAAVKPGGATGAKATATGDRAADVRAKDVGAKAAGASASAAVGATAANEESGAAGATKTPLPSKPVSTPKLVVKRTTAAEPPAAPLVVAKAETAPTKPSQNASAPPDKTPTVAPEAESRAHIAPVHAAPVVKEAPPVAAAPTKEPQAASATAASAEPAPVAPLKIGAPESKSAPAAAAAVPSGPAVLAQASPPDRRAARKKSEGRKERRKHADQAPTEPAQAGAPAASAPALPAPAAASGAKAAEQAPVATGAAKPSTSETKSAPAPAVATKPAPAAPSKPAEPKAGAAATASTAAPQAPAAATSGGRRYTVQLGAFSKRANAEALLAKVQARYADGQIVEAVANGAKVYRVVSGAFAAKAEADNRATALTAAGYSTYVRSLNP